MAEQILGQPDRSAPILPTRIGLEDTAVGPDGQAVAGNAELVRLALAAWTTARA